MHHKLIRWSLAYGGGAFVIGFLFGALRELVLIPAFGARWGHLAEFPLVAGSVALLGILIARRASPPPLAIGFGGALVLVLLESTLAVGLLGVPVADYLRQYDLTRGELFPLGLLVMVLAPLLGRRR
ncbi:MAG: hypothetical protein IPK75_00395 [Acidobacteria bacterium]|jgi:hypothetical protein|nr:hypothetical protein [Acidobacteriota bacterium]